MVCNHGVGIEEGVVLLVQPSTPPVNLPNSTLTPCDNMEDCPGAMTWQKPTLYDNLHNPALALSRRRCRDVH